MKPKKSKRPGGVVVSGGAYPEDHELETAYFLASLGYIVEFIVPLRIQGQKSADIIMDGLIWEIKRPKNWGKYTIEHAFQTAVKQAHNIIFDLHDLPDVQASAIRKIERERKRRPNGVKRLLIITSEGELIEGGTPQKRK